MIVVGIGQSGSGKTTYFKDKYIKEEACGVVEDEICPYTLSGGVALLGRYNVGKRTEGTDTLSYNIIPKLIEQLDDLVGRFAVVVAEGDRINNARFFDHLVAKRYPVTLILFTCSTETSLKRLRAAGSTITPTFLKTTKTKSLNSFLKYGRKFQSSEVRTT